MLAALWLQALQMLQTKQKHEKGVHFAKLLKHLPEVIKIGGTVKLRYNEYCYEKYLLIFFAKHQSKI